MKQLRLISVGAIVAAALVAPAQAGRPLNTDDAGVLGAGECELEGAALRLSAPGARATETGLQVGCGVGWHSQVAVGLAIGRADGQRESGLALAGKTGLWQGAGDDAAALTLGWRLSGGKSTGGGWHHAGTDLSLIASLPVAADYKLHANLGHARDEIEHRHATSWGLAIEHAGFAAAPRLAAMGELFGDDREAPWWNLGLRFAAVPERLFLDASYGRQLVGGRPRVVTLGFKFTF
jgi:hypothetical protein